MKFESYENLTVGELRSLLLTLGGVPGAKNKADLIGEINKIEAGETVKTRSKRGRPSNRSKGIFSMRFSDLFEETRVFAVAVENGEENIEAEGVLQIYSDGYGFLRRNGFLPKQGDVYVPRQTLQALNLKAGDRVKGECSLTKEKFYVLGKVLSVNGEPTPSAKVDFSRLQILYPDTIIDLFEEKSLFLKSLSVFNPISYGQRALVVCDEGVGVDMIQEEIVASAKKNDGDLNVFSLSVDVKIEDLFKFSEKDDGVERIGTCFDLKPSDHVLTSELVFNRAKRLVEEGKNALVAINSIEKLAVAYSAEDREVFEVTRNALEKIKNLFTLGRKTEKGSLTVIAFSDGSFEKNTKEFLINHVKRTANVILSVNCSNNNHCQNANNLGDCSLPLKESCQNLANIEKARKEICFKIKSKINDDADLCKKIYKVLLEGKSFDEILKELELLV